MAETNGRYFDAYLNRWEGSDGDADATNELVDPPSHMVYHEAAPDIAAPRPTYPVRLTEAELDALIDRTAPAADAPDGPPIYFVSLTEFEIERLLARLDD